MDSFCISKSWLAQTIWGKNQVFLDKFLKIQGCMCMDLETPLTSLNRGKMERISEKFKWPMLAYGITKESSDEDFLRLLLVFLQDQMTDMFINKGETLDVSGPRALPILSFVNAPSLGDVFDHVVMCIRNNINTTDRCEFDGQQVKYIAENMCTFSVLIRQWKV